MSHRPSTSGFEVDFIVGDHTAVEAKATALPYGEFLEDLWRGRHRG